jgi:hypothetical protein
MYHRQNPSKLINLLNVLVQIFNEIGLKNLNCRLRLNPPPPSFVGKMRLGLETYDPVRHILLDPVTPFQTPWYWNS